jgi:predicted PurR-regulated permease PerM
MLNLFNRKKEVIAISPSIIVFTTLFFLSLFFLYRIREIIISLLLGFIFMVALNPAVNKIQKKIKSRALSIVIVYLLVILFILSLAAILIPPLAVQLTQLVKSIQLPYFQEEIANLRFTVQELNQLASNYSGSINTLLSILNTTFRSVFTFITLLVISFYLIIDEPNLYKKIGWFTSNRHHFEIAKEFQLEIEDHLGGWIRGQFIIMLLVGFFTYLGLEIIGVPYALPLGLLAFLLEILPNLGPTLAAVPGIAIAWIHGDYISALVVLMFYIVVQQVESHLITPRTMKANADVNPLISILSILSGFILGGVIGGLLGIPTYIIFRTSYSYYRKYRTKLSPDW